MQFRETKMINLVKPSKVESNRRLHVANTRPISVMSAFWRIFASACNASIPEQVGAKPGSAGPEELAFVLYFTI